MNQIATVDTFTQHLNLSESTVETLLNLNATELPKEEAFQTELGTLNLDLLRETLPTAKSVLENQLPAFYVWLKQELPLSGFLIVLTIQLLGQKASIGGHCAFSLLLVSGT